MRKGSPKIRLGASFSYIMTVVARKSVVVSWVVRDADEEGAEGQELLMSESS